MALLQYAKTILNMVQVNPGPVKILLRVKFYNYTIGQMLKDTFVDRTHQFEQAYKDFARYIVRYFVN